MRSELLQPPSDEPFTGAAAAPPLPWRYFSAWAALLLVGPLVLLAQPLAPWLDLPLLHNGPAHLLIGLSAAVLGVVLALLVLLVARRARDGRVFMVGMAFLSIASIFLTHAISTPGVLMSGRDLATSFSALFSLWLGSVFFALSGLNFSPAANARLMRAARLSQVLFLAFWLCYNWVFLVSFATVGSGVAPPPAGHAAAPAAGGRDDYGDGYGAAPGPEDSAPAPEDVARPAIVAAVSARLLGVRVWIVALGILLYTFAGWRHYTFYRREPSQFGLALVCGTVLLGEALLTQFYAVVYSPLFWLYHAQEFLAFGAISYAVLVGYRRGYSRETLLESLLLAGTRARLQGEYIGAMDALIDALGRGDRPPPALRAALRERVGLSDSQVQVFERAARAVADERRQRKELEELNTTLRQLEMHKTQLTQMVVHDLKNPLTALIAYLEVLSISTLTDDQHELLTGALRSSRNLSALIGDLLDIARLEDGHFELEMSWFAVQDLLRDSVDSMQIWLTQEHKTVELSVPTASLLLTADLRLLRRVLSNLLSNAIKHTPPGTHIWLRATKQPAAPGQPSLLAIDVADNGPGIPAERLERIFERFGSFAGEQQGARQSSTGLGLTLCRLVAEAHGGSISVSSTLGQGATFRVLLPIADAELER